MAQEGKDGQESDRLPKLLGDCRWQVMGFKKGYVLGVDEGKEVWGSALWLLSQGSLHPSTCPEELVGMQNRDLLRGLINENTVSSAGICISARWARF